MKSLTYVHTKFEIYLKKGLLLTCWKPVTPNLPGQQMLDGRFEILHPVRLDQMINVNPFFGVVPRGHLAISHGRPRLKMDAAEGPFS